MSESSERMESYARFGKRMGTCMVLSAVFFSGKLAFVFYLLAVTAEQLRQYHLRKRMAVSVHVLGQECSICLEPDHQRGGLRLHCGHEFHENCIHTWENTLRQIYKSELTCPLCRCVSLLRMR